MIPQGGSIAGLTLQEIEQPSLTWQLDLERGRITGKIDGLQAVRQAVFKMLQTDRYFHAIYSFDYGHELAGQLGGSPLLVQSEAARLISEALLQDNRISAVDDIAVESVGAELVIRFTVVTQYGSFEEEMRRNV
ncbi:DUF2634 domain-containing protein [Paenibacillaceae bacterium]|nr:DUF2634 domain-containing protein [Paenibacillaceae bacterium]